MLVVELVDAIVFVPYSHRDASAILREGVNIASYVGDVIGLTHQVFKIRGAVLFSRLKVSRIKKKTVRSWFQHPTRI